MNQPQTHRADPFLTDADVVEVVRKFEAFALDMDGFRHAQHLAVGAYYLMNHPPQVALMRMRSHLQAFLTRKGIGGYHETITRFWLMVADDFLRSRPEEEPLVTKVNALVRARARLDLAYEHFSREIIKSDRARRRWVFPDRAPLPSASLARFCPTTPENTVDMIKLNPTLSVRIAATHQLEMAFEHAGEWRSAELPQAHAAWLLGLAEATPREVAEEAAKQKLELTQEEAPRLGG